MTEDEKLAGKLVCMIMGKHGEIIDDFDVIFLFMRTCKRCGERHRIKWLGFGNGDRMEWEE